MKMSIHTGQLKSKTPNYTAEFLLEMNNKFDVHNSKKLKNRPMSTHNKSLKILTFQNAKKTSHKTT